MATPDLNGLTVAALMTNGFEEVEYTEPRKALEDAGATVHLVSPEEGSIKAWDEDDWGGTYDVDKTLSSVQPSDYDALLLPGGQINPDKLRINEDVLSFVKHFFDNDKPVAAICHAPWLLIEAGVAEGRRLTGYQSIRTDLKNAGADVVDDAPVTDGNLVTARNPDDLPDFNDAVIELFAQAVPA